MSEPGEVQLFQLGKRMFLRPAAAVRRPVDGGIVQQHRDVVTGGAQVEFDHVGSRFDRFLQRKHGIFREFERGAAMGGDAAAL
ncbi:hypothetical protein SDC9_211001 [bioreactor metagenome]|uniref:Uncharacterized protein n=1 Tax=bioreactor metagenome TaxID=1076179 RepID=A0A645JTB6_9ZZZZ